MGDFSFFHWIIFLVMIALVLIPAAKILSKAGFSGWLSILLLVPLVNLICVWIFAFSKWSNSK
jgi:hypothetical protein